MFKYMLFSFLITFSFGILKNIPLRTLPIAGLVGMGGYLLAFGLETLALSRVFAVLLASFCVATISQLLAKYMKLPSINFSIVGIIPLVPGAMAFRTMRAFFYEEYIEGLALATQTFLVAGAIAAGLMLSLAIFSVGQGRRNSYGREDYRIY